MTRLTDSSQTGTDSVIEFFPLLDVIGLLSYAAISDFRKYGDMGLDNWVYGLQARESRLSEPFALEAAIPSVPVFFQTLELVDTRRFLGRYKDLATEVVGRLRASGGTPDTDEVARSMREALRSMLPYAVAATDDAEVALVGMPGDGAGTPDAEELTRLADAVDVRGCVLVLGAPDKADECARLHEVAAACGADVWLRLTPAHGALCDEVTQAFAMAGEDAVDEESDTWDEGGERVRVRWRTLSVEDAGCALPPAWAWVRSLGMETRERTNASGKASSKATHYHVLGEVVPAAECARALNSGDIDAYGLRWHAIVCPKHGWREVRKHNAHERRYALRQDLIALARKLRPGKTATIIATDFNLDHRVFPPFFFAELPLAASDGHVKLS